MFLRRTASACQETDVYSMGHAAAKWRTVVVLHDCVFTCQMSLAFLGAVAFSTPLTPGVLSRVATGCPLAEWLLITLAQGASAAAGMGCPAQ